MASAMSESETKSDNSRSSSPEPVYQRDQEAFEVYCEEREPMSQLHPAFVVDRKVATHPLWRGPIVLCFGFGIDSDLLVDYALKHGLTTQEKLSEGSFQRRGRTRASAMFDAQKHLKKKSRAARLHLRYPVHVKHDIVIALYDNYSKENEEMSEEHERIVLDYWRNALELPEDEMPLWYFEQD
ncbi:uncharacterized protein STEHIDRAFT_154384 [Stereum hirsutum FP-91666 SS1]|uniref:uncharacterized protein n=1 Tax=Stereum hirsutum (strain FP-91666) TaxID=721885 RepID=UPI000440E984|nr:uncharacterized protein STEHIDRAFT_154384 [Stereum hirsutum FP-91666 SS1]EIM88656.1 hypothetical protein STEHIDRAFT_154384 [Stereum hirsutum FP-91666 SS1]